MDEQEKVQDTPTDEAIAAAEAAEEAARAASAEETPTDAPADEAPAAQEAGTQDAADPAPGEEESEDTPADVPADPPADSPTDSADAERLKAMESKLRCSMAEAAALKLGVPEGRMKYLLRMADIDAIQADAEDAPERIDAALRAVLADVPELGGTPQGTGGTGNHRRDGGAGEDLAAASARAMGLK